MAALTRSRGTGGPIAGAIAGVVVVLVGGLVVLGGLAPVSGFTRTHYLFTYQDGFLRRALVGSVVALLGPDRVTADVPLLLGVAYLMTLVLMVGGLVAQAWRRGDPTVVLLLATLFVGASQLRILANDVGKFDALLLALTVVVALLSGLDTRWPIVVIALLGVIGVLVHELHLVAGVPVAVAMVGLRAGRAKGRVMTAAAVALPPLIVGGLLALLAGDPPGGSVAAAEARMALRAGFSLEDSAAFVQGLDPAASIRMTLDVLRAETGPMLRTVLVAVPPALAGVLLIRSGRERSPRPAPWVLATAALTPVLLLPLGFDWYRWLTIAVMNLIVVGLRLQVGADASVRPDDGSARTPGVILMVAAVALSLVLPSIGPAEVVRNLEALLR